MIPVRVLLLTVAGFILFGAVFLYSKLNANVYSPSNYLHLSTKDISLIVVNNNETQVAGLSGLEELPADKAMLFVFNEPGKYGIWMKDMKFHIDIMWLDEQKKIVSIQHNVSPSTYPKVFYPTAESSYVLEANALFAKENNLSVGKILNFDTK